MTLIPNSKKLPRLKTKNAAIDGWVDSIVSAVERNSNVTASGGIQARVGPMGIHLAYAAKHWQWAKSSASGIPAMSGSTPGKADDIVLYDFNGTTLASQTITETAYNLGSTAVGASKWLLLAKIDKYWFVLWEDCPA